MFQAYTISLKHLTLMIQDKRKKKLVLQDFITYGTERMIHPIDTLDIIYIDIGPLPEEYMI